MMKATTSIRLSMLAYMPLLLESPATHEAIHPLRRVTGYGSNRKARSSFKQNRRLQMKSSNFKAKF